MNKNCRNIFLAAVGVLAVAGVILAVVAKERTAK